MRRITICAVALIVSIAAVAQPIDREKLVRRHNITLTHSMEKSPTQVGNGKFAYGADITGMQTFIPFSTLSDWGWHEFPLPEGVKVEDYKPVVIESYGKKIPYIDRNEDLPEISEWLRGNPHRINLGRLGLALTKSDGTPATEDDLTDARQTVDVYTGLVTSAFRLEGTQAVILSSCDPEQDMLAFSIESDLLKSGRMKVFLELPYADTKEFNSFIGDFDSDSRHTSTMTSGTDEATVTHTLDATRYYVKLHWYDNAAIVKDGAHRYVLSTNGDRLDFCCLFTENPDEPTRLSAREVAGRSMKTWTEFWKSGAAVDLSGSKDPRWFELERRIVLSQYQLRLNECGLFPPQESGLVNNGWFGRFHWEMVWWHMAHYALWNRMDCYSRVHDWYEAYLPGARERAASEGRTGARWPKCTGNINREWPCAPHAFLVWQQPHPIWFAEAEYRMDKGALERWKDLVLETADYMASSLFWDGKRYVIGPPVVPVSENTDYETTLNPIFEIEYYRYGFETALKWAERLGLPKSRTKAWRKALKHLSDLPQEDGYYKTAESMQNMWEDFNFEHPALTGIYGWLPGSGVDIETFRRTFYKVLDTWQMDKVWGWDYPMLAMAAARLGDRQRAVDLLCEKAHKYDFDEHGLSLAWPFPYFPSNGGVLTAIAMMCEGWDGSEGSAPGFPDDGSWTVRYEGFNTMQ